MKFPGEAPDLHEIPLTACELPLFKFHSQVAPSLFYIPWPPPPPLSHNQAHSSVAVK